MEKQDAIDIFTAAVKSVQPAALLREWLAVNEDSITIGELSFSKSSIKNIYVIGAGKASAAMASETEKILGDYITEGLVTTKYHHALPCRRINIMEAAHPVPDENGVRAVSKTIQLLNKATEDDIIICLVSGGASALWCDLPEGITLKEMQTSFDILIKSGAAIDEVNTIRKHLSKLKGGQLIRHCHGAKVFSFIISDVPGDGMDVIASGPTVADPSSFHDAYAVLEKYNLLNLLPGSIRSHIEKGIHGIIEETPKTGDLIFANSYPKIIGNNAKALEAASKRAEALGYHVCIIYQLITGDAAAEAKKLMQFAFGYNGPKPVCILQGGETTVRVTGKGKGGRNQHFVLTALKELVSLPKENLFQNITILSGGTDGTDGPTDAAGAVVDLNTLKVILKEDLSIDAYLDNNDAYHFFEKSGSLLITGPTQTNVMDIMMVIIK
jgi:glycerate-2-kinase